MTRMSICCVGLCGFLAVRAAVGSELFRCVAADGGVAWQDVPCETGSRLSRTVPIPVEQGRDVGQQVAEKKAKAAKRPTPTSRNNSTRVRPGARSQARANCAKAREERERVLAQVGLARTFEQLRALDDRVYDACKGL